jgi:uncharacterized membrane protein
MSQMTQLHSRYTDSMLVGVTGLTVTTLDLLKGGTIIMGLIGAVLAALGGWEAWRAKRLERRMRELEIERMQRETPSQ